MAGFLEDVGEFFIGDKQRAENAASATKQAEANTAMANAQAGVGQQAAESSNLGRQYQQGASSSMGVDATDYMKKAESAAQGQAAQAAQAGSLSAARQALMAARAGGLNKGQASMRAGQMAGDAYTDQYQQGLQSGRSQYGQAAQQLAQMGTQQQQLAQSGYGQQGAIGSAMSQADTAKNNLGVQQAAAGGQALSGIVSGLGSVFSDKNLKENIKPSGNDLEDLVSKVRRVDFNYKTVSGEDPEKDRQGVLAQDLEKTGMKDNVIDTPEGKKIDAGQQTLSNTNLIVQLAEELFAIKAELKSFKGGK